VKKPRCFKRIGEEKPGKREDSHDIFLTLLSLKPQFLAQRIVYEGKSAKGNNFRR